MTFRDFPLLADLNIAPDVVDYLRGEGLDVVSARDQGWDHEDDSVLLTRAVADDRVMLTRDGDFGTLAIQFGLPYLGIVRLRPGNLTSPQTITLIQELILMAPELTVPFILTVKQTDAGVRIRIR
jgi:predicted nuclease of predicted toxin-antitoxin system